MVGFKVGPTRIVTLVMLSGKQLHHTHKIPVSCLQVLIHTYGEDLQGWRSSKNLRGP